MKSEKKERKYGSGYSTGPDGKYMRVNMPKYISSRVPPLSEVVIVAVDGPTEYFLPSRFQATALRTLEQIRKTP